MAHDGDRLFFVELVEGARADLIHGHEDAVGEVRGGVLPGLADVEQKRWVVGGELLFELVDGDLKVHGLRIKDGMYLSNVVRELRDANANGLTIVGVGQRIANLGASQKIYPAPGPSEAQISITTEEGL